MSRQEDARARARYSTAVILAGAVLAQLLLVIHLGDRTYTDVMRSVGFGAGVETGVVSIRSHVDNTKTFLGPLLSYRLVAAYGVAGLKAFNVAVFVAIFAVQAAIGRRLFDRNLTAYALVLTAFYTGTLRNVAASEPEDMIASLLFALGAFGWLAGRSAVLTGLVMGCAFLFKFWILIFFGGFLLVLSVRREWVVAAAAGTAFAVPFLCVNVVDGGASLFALLGSVERQRGYSPWPVVAFRLLSTGLVPAFLAAGLAAGRRPGHATAFTFLVPAPYLFYVVAMRDAFATTFVMMLCLVFWSFPIALLLREARVLAVGRRRHVALALYLIAAPLNAWWHLWRDTQPFQIVPGCYLTPVSPSAKRIEQGCTYRRGGPSS